MNACTRVSTIKHPRIDMQLDNLFHISTKEERKKVAKKERRKYTAAATAHTCQLFLGRHKIEELEIETSTSSLLSSLIS